MSDLIQANYRLLRVLPRFGIHLGFGDKSVAEVCRAQGVSMELFLLVCNISTFDDFLPDTAMFKGIDVEDIVLFLQNSHKYYLEQRIPEIRENLSSLEEGPGTSSARILDRFFNDYRNEVEALSNMRSRRYSPISADWYTESIPKVTASSSSKRTTAISKISSKT